MNTFNENTLEQASIEILQSLGYEYKHGPEISYGSSYAERNDYRTVILEQRVKDALFRINRDLPIEALEEAFRQVITFNSPMLEENNRYFHNLLVNGIDVTFKEGSNIRTKRAYLIDFNNPFDTSKNDFLVVNQFTVIENEERRPDLVIFINGLPIVVVELKSMSDEQVSITQAYNQIQTYKKDIPSLFSYNAFCVLSDGVYAKAGTITSNEERFMNWRTVDGVDIAPIASPQYEVLFKGMFSKDRLLDIVRNFILFQESHEDDYNSLGEKIGSKKSIIKILAAYHQYFAVKKAVEKTKEATSINGDRKVGVVWHTQGSGKSLSMVFYTAQLVQHLNNPTIVVITDRNDLDNQLYSTFCKSQDILRQTPKQAHVRRLSDKQKEQQSSSSKEFNGLYDLLNDRESGGIIFTTIQKFSQEGSSGSPAPQGRQGLCDRTNIVVIADEAHRTQYGLSAKVNKSTGEIKYGYAKHLRDALPNASFIGFTGTPIEFDDKSTPAVFGEYIDIYDMTRSVEDKSTVKIYYENRIIKLDTNDEALKQIDAEFEEVTENQEYIQKEKNKSKWTRLEAIVGSPNRVKKLAEDIIHHYEEKTKTISGKAMIVCMSRRICSELYDEIIALKPEWHSDDVNKGKIKVVMTGSASDEVKLQQHVGGKQRRDTLAKRMKDISDELKIVIVRDMWLTGFDVPNMHTMYIDKPMQGHNLMQAIARVNRVFKDKTGGVVVDYIGIFENLKRALSQYTDTDRENTGIDTSVAVSIMLEKLEILQNIMHGFDYSNFMKGLATERIKSITGGMNFILGKSDKDQKEFKNIVIQLAKAHSLCAATDEGKRHAVEVSYFKAVKGSLVKLRAGSSMALSPAEIQARIKQMLERSIISEEVIDVFEVMGIKRPDISILSEEFLNELKSMKHKNLAVEMLKKLLEGKIKAIERKNVVKSDKFSEKLKQTLIKYRNQAITNVEVIEELINMAHEMKQNDFNQQKLGLTEDEIAFYDALTKDKIVKELMQDKVLKQIAQELTNAIRRNVTVDWSIRKSAQANMRRIIKRLLKKYGYPPKQSREALKVVMRQAELMCGNEYSVTKNSLGLVASNTDNYNVNQYGISTIKEKLSSALYEFKKAESYLLKNDVNERSISNKLAQYLVTQFTDYDVDTEYNKNINNSKEIYALKCKIDRSSTSMEREYRNVYPDIIVHKRGTNDSNLLVIEIKKSTNNSDFDIELDDEKLRCYTSLEDSLRYKYGFYIKLFTGEDYLMDPLIKVYGNGEILS